MEFSVNAIMPGLVARVVVDEGENVKQGQELAVINCMKSEISVTSGKDGVVQKILVKEWDEMQVDTPMIILNVED